MGHVFLAGGAVMLAFVSTEKGFQYRWVAVFFFIVLFAGTVLIEQRQIDQKVLGQGLMVIQIK